MPKIACRFAFDDLRRLIISGQMGAPGKILPAENTLAASYKVSRPTIRKALQMLAEENLLESQAGVGWRLLERGEKKDRLDADRKNRHIRIGIDTNADLCFWGYFYYDLIQNGLKRGAEESDCELVLLNNSGKEKVDGIILSRFTSGTFEKYEPVLKSGIPVAVLNRIMEDPRFFCFSVDHMKEAKKAVEYLLLLGHREIAILVDGETPALRDRLNGWYLAFASNGLMPPEHLILRDSSLDALDTFLKIQRPTAFFISQGLPIGHFLMATERRGLRIPEDVSILCFDDMSRQPFLDIPVSHIRMPLEEMGRRAVHTVSERLRTPRKTDSLPHREILEAELVISSSCKNVNKQKIISEL